MGDLLDLLGEVAARLELHDLLGLDLDFLAGLRVATLAGSTLGNGEGSEAYECYAVTLLESLGGGTDESIECFLGISLGELGLSCNCLN